MKLQIDVQLDYWFEHSCDILLQVEAAQIPEQIIEHAHLTVTPDVPHRRVPAQDGIGERMWLRAQWRVVVDYTAHVSIDRNGAGCAHLPAAALGDLPGDAVQYLLPSRYCQSNQFTDFVDARFGALAGGAKVAAIRDWIAGHLSYVPGSSHAETTAVDTFHSSEGICRDYAHLMITLARAADIPARFASVYAPGVAPPDFHAVAEIYLGDAWHLVDPTGMASAGDMAIIGIGRDSGDVAFLTAFGPLVMNGQSVAVRAM